MIEILRAAGGFTFTRREIYLELIRRGLPPCRSRVGPPTYPFFLPMVIPDRDGHRYLGEDFAFSERVRRCGYKIVADTTIRLQHIGVYGYGWEDVGGSLPRSNSYELNL